MVGFCKLLRIMEIELRDSRYSNFAGVRIPHGLKPVPPQKSSFERRISLGQQAILAAVFRSPPDAVRVAASIVRFGSISVVVDP